MVGCCILRLLTSLFYRKKKYKLAVNGELTLFPGLFSIDENDR